MISDKNITGLVVDDVKEYLRIEYDYDDSFIALILSAAKSFISNQLKMKFEEFGDEIPEELTIACLALCSHWYEKREIVTDKKTEELSFLFSSIIDMHRDILGVEES